MKMKTGSSDVIPSYDLPASRQGRESIYVDPRFHGDDFDIQGNDKRRDNLRTCPNCNLLSLKGMPGGIDAVCKNCGYKDPCCSD